MSELRTAKIRLVLFAVAMAAALALIILAAPYLSRWLYLVAAVLLAAIGLVFSLRNRDKEPYVVARYLFALALYCSWQLLSSAMDPALRRGAWIIGMIAAIGMLVGYEMKLRATRHSGSAQ